MTTVLLLGATGRAGTEVLTHLPDETRVVAALRAPGDESRLPATDHRTHPVVVDSTDRTSLRQAARGADVIVNAIRLRGDIGPTALIDVHQRILDAVEDLDTEPLVVTVGGAGALRLSDGTPFWQHPAFPVPTLPRGRAHDRLRTHLEAGLAGTGWSYLIPPPAFDPDGAATGRYAAWPAAVDETAHTRRAVSYADYAAAVAAAVNERWTGTRLIAGS
ncbi:NAD(P)-dependent oxidoreductase [Mycolicibacterium thermoresistibile]